MKKTWLLTASLYHMACAVFIIFNFKRNLFPWFIKESRKIVGMVAVRIGKFVDGRQAVPLEQELRQMHFIELSRCIHPGQRVVIGRMAADLDAAVLLASCTVEPDRGAGTAAPDATGPPDVPDVPDATGDAAMPYC